MFARRFHQHPHSTRASSFFSVLTPIFYDGPDEIAVRKHRRRQRALHPWKTGVCASLRLIGWPMRGFPQSLVTTFLAGTNPASVGLNPVTNQVYAASSGRNDATVFMAATDLAATEPVESSSHSNRSSITAILVTNGIFLTKWGDDTVAAISEEHRQPLLLNTPLAPISMNVISLVWPAFTFVRSVGRSVFIVRYCCDIGGS